jgi:hypothetical protein
MMWQVGLTTGPPLYKRGKTTTTTIEPIKNKNPRGENTKINTHPREREVDSETRGRSWNKTRDEKGKKTQ